MSRYSYESDDDVRVIGRGALWAVIIVFGLILLGGVFTVWQAQVDHQVREQTGPLQDTNYDARKAQSERFNKAYTQLKAISASLRHEEGELGATRSLYGEDPAKWPLDVKQEYAQRQKTVSQYTESYNQACATYQAAWGDEFKTQAAPKDLPRDCEYIN